MKDKQKKLLDEMYEEVEIDVAYVIEDYNDIDSLMDKLQELVYEIEVIYYHVAMEYLTEHDTSLQESLGLAHDMGCTLDNLNSETLATLLKQQNASEKLHEYKDELEELFFSE